MVEPSSDSRVDLVAAETTGELRRLGAGQVLGRYTLLRRVAAGGMAEVYSARSRMISGFEKKVAIKKILPQFSLNKRFIDMLVDEAKITVSLTHPNIAQVYELGLEEDTYYIVMEYVDGRPLNRLMQKVDVKGNGTVPVEHAVHIMAEVAKGLNHAHHQKDPRGKPLGIIHRDVSPQNVLIAYTGDVKLIDFGIARATGRVAQTSAGVIKGKLRYLAPEIALGGEPDHRADIYCCGIVLFELLTGEAMFAPRTDAEAIELASAARVRSPRATNPAVPAELDDIVMMALRRDRDQRYGTAKALYTDLRRFLNQYFPAYVGSELGDFMQAQFVAEIADERRMDGIAERIAEAVDRGELVAEGTLRPALPSEPPPPLPPPASQSGSQPLVVPVRDSGELKRQKYKELVTRASIELELGGPAIGPSEPSMPVPALPPQPNAASSGTPRAASAPGGASAPAGAATSGPAGLPPVPSEETGEALTVAEDPGLAARYRAALAWATSDEEAMTVAGNALGPAPKPAEGAAPPLSASGAVPVPALGEEITRAPDAPVAPSAGASTTDAAAAAARDLRSSAAVRLAASKSSSFTWLVVAVAAAAFGLAVWQPWATHDTTTPPVKKPIPGETAPSSVPSELPTAVVLVQVSPPVKVDVLVDGVSRAEGVTPPILLNAITVRVMHKVRVIAPGYLPFEVEVLPVEGENKVIGELHPVTGMIIVEGLSNEPITANAGRVEEDRVLEVPLHHPIELKIQRRDGKVWTKELVVDSIEPVTLVAPKLPPLPHGKLTVSSRPYSEVYLNDKKVGTTPQDLSLPPGVYRVTLKMADGKTQTFKPQVRSGKTASVQWRR